MSSTEQVRFELMAALSQLGRMRPEWRLGQTLANLAMTAGRLDIGGVWDLEDEEALAAAKTLIEQYCELEPRAADPVSGSVEIAIAATRHSSPANRIDAQEMGRYGSRTTVTSARAF